MAAVCYTCYRPARTGYVRQSIALILALGAALCVRWSCAPRCRPYTVSTPRSSCPLTHSRDPLYRSSQELHHQVITFTSSHVHPRWCQRRRTPTHSRSFPKPLRPVTAHHRGVEFEKVREIDVSTLRITSHFDKPVRYFGSLFWPRRYPHRLSYIAEQYPASFGLLPEKP